MIFQASCCRRLIWMTNYRYSHVDWQVPWPSSWRGSASVRPDLTTVTWYHWLGPWTVCVLLVTFGTLLFKYVSNNMAWGEVQTFQVLQCACINSLLFITNQQVSVRCTHTVYDCSWQTKLISHHPFISATYPGHRLNRYQIQYHMSYQDLFLRRLRL